MDSRHRLAGALAALALLLPSMARSSCTIETAELPVTMVGVRAIATVRINGTNVPMMVDSGAFYSILTEAAAAQLKLKIGPMPGRIVVKGAGGTVDTGIAVVHRLELLGGDIPDVEFVVGGSDPGSGAMGVIGRNILSAADTEYDLAHGAIRLVFPGDGCGEANMAYWAGDQPVSEVDLLRDNDDRLRRPAIRGIVKVNDKKLLALFDSGAYSTVMALRAAHRLGLADSDMARNGTSYGADGRPVRSWTAPFAKIDIGGEVISNNCLRVADYDVEEDMLLGIDFFLSHRIYVSSKQQRMYFTYNGGPVFAQNRGVAPAAVADAASASDTLSADEHARRGAASLSRNDLAAALADLDRACAMAPANASFLAIRASIHVHMKHPSLALADLDAALRLAPADVQALLARAALHAEAHARDLAAADLAAADKLLSPQANEHTIIATLHERNQMPERAIPQWTQWIATHPHDIRLEQAYNGRCWDRMLLDRELDMAMKDCEEALDFDSKNFHNLDTRGWLWLRMGQTANARADFDKAIALHKEAGTSLYGRGILRLRAGDAAGAHADFVAARAAEHGIDAMMKDFGLPLAPDAAEATAAAVAVSASASAAAH